MAYNKQPLHATRLSSLSFVTPAFWVWFQKGPNILNMWLPFHKIIKWRKKTSQINTFSKKERKKKNVIFFGGFLQFLRWPPGVSVALIKLHAPLVLLWGKDQTLCFNTHTLPQSSHPDAYPPVCPLLHYLPRSACWEGFSSLRNEDGSLIPFVWREVGKRDESSSLPPLA